MDFESYKGLDEDEEPEKPDEDDADESTTLEALRAKIEDIPDHVPSDILHSLETAMDTVEAWLGRSVRSMDWQRIINQLDKKVVANLEVGRFSQAKESLDVIHEEILDLKDQSRS